MYIDFDPESLNYDAYFLNSAKQSGHGLAAFQGTRFQRGAGQSGQGLGNVFKSLWHVLFPIVKSIGRSVGKEALLTGTQIASDVLEGQEPIESMKKHGRAAAGRLLDKAQTNLQQQSGMGRKRKHANKARKAKKRKTTKRQNKPRRVSHKKKREKKRFGSDALGLLN